MSDEDPRSLYERLLFGMSLQVAVLVAIAAISIWFAISFILGLTVGMQQSNGLGRSQSFQRPLRRSRTSPCRISAESLGTQLRSSGVLCHLARSIK